MRIPALIVTLLAVAALSAPAALAAPDTSPAR
jgi:hypothetical protein